ncbi:MAG: signal recognition particle protein [Vampirovibrionales bacterium]|nr:signal recognition particle protein [Vampirovibrionales bacterium]
MFDRLTDRLQTTIRSWQGKSTLSADNMADALREVRRALLEADVNLQVVKRFMDRLQDDAVGQRVLNSVEPGEQLIKLVHDELVTLLGGQATPVELTGNATNPDVILMVGLQGSGKTTTTAKLAKRLAAQGKTPYLIAADVYRPAAIQQLQQLGSKLNVPVFTVEGEKNVPLLVAQGVAAAKAAYEGNGADVILIDTAGRLQVDTELMAELMLIKIQQQPNHTLLVVDAMMGQEAVGVAQAFDTQLGITGVVLSKTDGDSRGGAALSVAEMTGKPIVFMGTGETPDGIEPFHPDRMASRLLGMGDVVTLVERAQQAVDAKQSAEMEAKIRKATFSFDDFMAMQKQLKMLGSLGGILELLPIPGLDKQAREQLSNLSDTHLKKFEVIIQSMTAAERAQPELLQQKPKRVARIAKGCGQPEKEVKQFLLQFNQMKVMMQQMSKMTGPQQNDANDETPQANPAFAAFGTSNSWKKKAKEAKGLNAAPTMPTMPGMGGLGGLFGGKPPKAPNAKNPTKGMPFFKK